MTQNLSEKTGISYIRWSTLDQGNSDRSSEFRQNSDITEFAARHDITIASRLVDNGKSAYTGKNLTDGELGKLTKQIHTGVIDATSTVLIVEELDRLSRQPPATMIAWMQPLLALGLTICIAKTGRIIDQRMMNEDISGFFMLIFEQFTSHDFGRKQQGKGNAAWEKRRIAAAETGTLTARIRGRGWLQWNPAKKAFDVIEERAAIIREMLALAESGYGKATIAKIFNERAATDSRYAPFSTSKKKSPKAWTATAIKRIVHDRAVCGYVQFNKAPRNHDVKIPIGEPVKIYPAIIDEDQWARVNDAKAKAAATSQGRGRAVSNLFGPLAKCGECGGTMQPLGSSRWVTRKNGERTQHYFIYCNTAKMTRGVGCSNQRGWPYSKVERPLIDKILTLALDDQHFESSDEVVANLTRDLAAAKRAHASIEQRRARLLDIVADGGDVMERALYDRTKKEAAAANAEVETIATQLAEARGATSPAEHIVRVSEVRDRMESEDVEQRYQARSLVKAALAELIDDMIFNPDTGCVNVTLAKANGLLFIRPDGHPANLVDGETSFFNMMKQGRDHSHYPDGERELIAAYERRVFAA